MEPSTCLFSRARPGKSSHKKVRGFLPLPGEIRNQIYGYYFGYEFRCEIAAKGSQTNQHKPKTVKLWAGAFQTNSQRLKYNVKPQEAGPKTIRISRPLGKYIVVQGLQTNWFGSLFAIILVCKQIHAETLPFIYQKTTYVFDAPKRILNFLDVVSSSKLEYITKMELHYSTYGEPRYAHDCVWKDKHHKSWIRACSAASKHLIGIRCLKIWMRTWASPLRCNLRESWVLPLLQFRRLTRVPTNADGISNLEISKQQLPNLDRVDVDFWSRLLSINYPNPQLREANDKLHRLFGEAIKLAILGAKEEVAMANFNAAWNGKYAMWQHHLHFANTGW